MRTRERNGWLIFSNGHAMHTVRTRAGGSESVQTYGHPQPMIMVRLNIYFFICGVIKHIGSTIELLWQYSLDFGEPLGEHTPLAL